MPVTILIDAVLLLLKESKIHLENSSVNRIKNLLELDSKKSSKWVLGEEDVSSKIMNIILEIIDSIENEEPIMIDSILRKIRLEIIEDDELAGDDALKETIVTMLESVNIEKPFEEELKDIDNLNRSLTMFFTREKLKHTCKQVQLELTRNKTANPYNTLNKLLEELDGLATTSSSKHDSEMAELGSDDIDDKDKMAEFSESVKHKHIFNTGWKALNLMLQGGVRTSEAAINAALTHNFKTGFILSVWVSILLFNKPKPGEGRPTAVWFSFEDEIVDIMVFIYKLVIITETGQVANKPDMSVDELIRWVIGKLSKNGWNIKILRIDPSDYTYRDIINKIKKYRASGLDVQACVTDYADKISTAGIKSTGPTGSDKKELVRRLRNYFSSIDCWWDTPWQFNPSAGDLRKNGVDDTDFLNYVYDKGYYQGVTTLGNEMDLELFTHIVKTPRNGDWLHVRKGKHKTPAIVPKKYHSFYLPFPSDGPIPFDFNKDEAISRNSVLEDNIFYNITSDVA